MKTHVGGRCMARHGENIRKRKDGRWEARYQVFDADKDRKIYRSVYGSSYAAAKEKRSAAMQKTENPAASGPCTAVPFSQAAQEWLQEIADRRKHPKEHLLHRQTDSGICGGEVLRIHPRYKAAGIQKSPEAPEDIFKARAVQALSRRPGRMRQAQDRRPALPLYRHAPGGAVRAEMDGHRL